MVTITIALLRAYLLSDVENDGGDEGDGGQEGHGGQQGHGDNPPLERYAAAVDALRQDGSGSHTLWHMDSNIWLLYQSISLL